MKKILLFAAVAAAFSMTSCSTVSYTSKSADVKTSITSPNTAELNVSDKVATATITTDAKQRRGGLGSIKSAAIQKCLRENGGGDVLVSPQFEVVERKNLSGRKVISVTVTGHPATYKNVHLTTKSEAEVLNILNGNITTVIPACQTPVCNKK